MFVITVNREDLTIVVLFTMVYQCEQKQYLEENVRHP